MTKSEMKKLKSGDRVIFSKGFKSFWRNNAYELCVRSTRATREDFDAYLTRKAVGMGLKYRAYVAEVHSKLVEIAVVVGSTGTYTRVAPMDIRLPKKVASK